MTDDDLDRVIRDAAEVAEPSGACLDGETLTRFYQDNLSSEQADAVMEHLSTCPACLETARDAWEFVAAMQQTLPDAAAPPAPRLRYAAAAFVGAIALFAGTTYLLYRAAAPVEPWARLPLEPAPYDALVWRSGAPTPGADPLDAAMTRYRAADYAGAIEDLAGYVDRHPDDARGRFYLGVARLLHGDPAAAAIELDAAAALDDAPDDTAWYRAVAHLRSGNPTTARPVLERLAAVEGPRRGEALALLGALDDGPDP